MSRVDKNAVIDALTTLFSDPAYSPDYDLVWDARYISELVLLPENFSPILRVILSQSVRIAKGRIVALVNRDPVAIIARLYQAVMRRMGREMEVFSTIEQAAKWLGDAEGKGNWLRQERGSLS